ncbi:MAG TPA: hypothetical protein VH763_02990 [Gemmatimonadales bacterium]|jgi:hypothetical protein
MALTEVTRTYLEMTTPEQLRSVPPPQPAPRIERVGECPVSFFRYLYARWAARSTGPIGSGGVTIPYGDIWLRRMCPFGS